MPCRPPSARCTRRSCARRDLVGAAFSAWSFAGQWRGYQRGCLDAFEADRAAGRGKTLLVAPPGSGKTIVGLEIVRRIGVPAVVLCPTRTIQRQWAEKQALFGPASADLHALTYHALCQTSDPEGALRDGASRAVGARARRGDGPAAGGGRRRGGGVGRAGRRAPRARHREDRRAPEAARRGGHAARHPRGRPAVGRRARAPSRGCATPACASSCSTSAITCCRCGARC